MDGSVDGQGMVGRETVKETVIYDMYGLSSIIDHPCQAGDP